jgi:hypothetical protein
LIFIIFSGYSRQSAPAEWPERDFDDAKLIKGVKKRLKRIVNYALKFCKQVLDFTFSAEKIIFAVDYTKQDSGFPEKCWTIQNYDRFSGFTSGSGGVIGY